jgi:hypothetical protein
MADVVLISRADGGLSVMRPVGEAFDAAAEVARWSAGVDPSWLPVTWRVADDSVLPADRTDRDSWVDDGTSVAVDAARKAGLAATLLAALRAEAKALLDEARAAQYKLTRAVVLVSLDEVNLLRQWITDFKAEVALASSLADLKARVATLDSLAQRTATQAKTAVRNRIDTADAD